MIQSRPTDVFISHSQSDVALASQVADVLRSYDLQVLTENDVPPGDATEDVVWDAIAECKAIVAVVSGGEPRAWTAVEIGAAKAWNKPIYGVVSDPTLSRFSPIFHGVTMYPPTRVDEIAQDIKRISDSLTEAETGFLFQEYRRIGIPADRLAVQPKHLTELTKNFAKRAKRQVPGEQLLSHLLRFRKQGALPALGKEN